MKNKAPNPSLTEARRHGEKPERIAFEISLCLCALVRFFGRHRIAVKFGLFASILLLGMFFQTSFGAEKTEITVTVTGISSTVGKLRMIVFSSAEGFPNLSEKGMWHTSLDITGKTQAVTLPRVDVGRYAISVLHDADGNGNMKTNFLGIPTEGTGVTRNVRPAMRAPRFDECAMDFTVGTQAATIAMVYP